MTINQEEFKSAVGLDDVYIAQVVADSLAAYSAGTPQYLAPSITASAKPKTDQTSQYADNQVWDVVTSEAESDLVVEITNCPMATLALLTGKQFDVSTGRVIDMPGVAPFFALGFRSQKSNGKQRYQWFLKVMFSMPEEAWKTIADKKEPQTVKLNAKAIKTTYQWTVNAVTDGVKRVIGDDDTDSFVSTGWFTQVQVPGVAAIPALALSSSVPANNASGISKTAALTLTFNNKLAADAVSSVSLMDATPALVVCTVTADVTGKILTMAHSALAGTIAHTIVIAVKDIYGQTLNQLVKFTTAA